ncbi:MAG: adenine deaminase [Erysipelotrichaceae bacterium]
MELLNLKVQRDLFNAKIEADLVLLNVNVLDPFQAEFRLTDLTIHQGKIVAMKALRSKNILDMHGSYASPLMSDAHMHIESTTVLPSELNDFLIPRGVGMLIADPHEIANVAGTQGIDFILAASENLELDIRVMLPSCVPSTAFEHSGAILKAADLQPYLSHPRVLGLAEVMDREAVRFDDDMLEKITNTRMAGKKIDGHGSNLETEDLDLYSMLGILTDHECVNAEQALARISRGFHVLIREGTVTKNLSALLEAVTPKNFRRFCFCTDDKHPDDLRIEGGVDAVVRQAIALGLDPAMALTMATLNPAECYRLEGKGALAPGYDADFFLFDDPLNIDPTRVYKNGIVVASDHQIHVERKQYEKLSASLGHSINFAPFTQKDLAIWLYPNKQARVMNVLPGNVLTRLTIETSAVDKNGFYQCDPERDLAKLCVIERHHASGNIGCCPVKGFKLNKGAIGSSVAHDSHNLVIVGTNDEDIVAVADDLRRIGGGYVVVSEGKVLASVTLEIGGLMSSSSLDEALDEWKKLHLAFNHISDMKEFNPFLMLSFMSLPVIPEVKCTDIGLIDVVRGKVLDIAVYEEEK